MVSLLGVGPGAAVLADLVVQGLGVPLDRVHGGGVDGHERLGMSQRLDETLMMRPRR